MKLPKKLPMAIAQVTSLVGALLYLWLWEPHEFPDRPGPIEACFPDPDPISSECDEYCWTIGAAEELHEEVIRLDEEMDLLVEAVHDWQDRGSPPLKDPE